MEGVWTMVRNITEKKENKRKVVVARIDLETFNRLKGICQEQGTTMDALLNARINNWLKTQKARNTRKS